MILSNSEPHIGYKTGHRDSWIVHIIKCLKDKLCCSWPPPPLQFGARDQDILSCGPKSDEQNKNQKVSREQPREEDGAMRTEVFKTTKT